LQFFFVALVALPCMIAFAYIALNSLYNIFHRYGDSDLADSSWAMKIIVIGMASVGGSFLGRFAFELELVAENAWTLAGAPLLYVVGRIVHVMKQE
jgi:hypothetical protein